MDQVGINTSYSQKDNSVEVEHYKAIGQVLSILEASRFRVGVPCLLPTPIVRKLSQKIAEPIEEYIRVNLVNTRTEVLESYIDDLRNIPLSIENNCSLGIYTPSDTERYGVFTLFIAISSLIGFCIFGLPESKIGWFLLGVFSIFELIIWFINLLFGSEHYRRNTFIWYTNNELLRRRGISPGQTASAIKAE